MKKIALIIPYFGKFNNYFELWRKTAEFNSDIDFFLFTDQHVESCFNIKIIQTSFESVISLTQQKLLKHNISIAIGGRKISPYKLCDFKPLYGIIFEDFLVGYDFWGHCDVDLLFGDIRHFITDDILDKYDRILSRGHFSLYRNNQETNMTFLLSKNNTVGIPSYEVVFSSADSYSFDEWPGLSRIWRALKNDKMFDKIIFDDIAVLYGHFVSYQKIALEKNSVSNVIFEYDSGHLYRHCLENGTQKKEETMYVHLQKRIMKVKMSSTVHFLIIPNAFVDYETVNIPLLRHYGRTRLFYPHAISIRWNNLKRRLKKCLESFV